MPSSRHLPPRPRRVPTSRPRRIIALRCSGPAMPAGQQPPAGFGQPASCPAADAHYGPRTRRPPRHQVPPRDRPAKDGPNAPKPPALRNLMSPKPGSRLQTRGATAAERSPGNGQASPGQAARSPRPAAEPARPPRPRGQARTGHAATDAPEPQGRQAAPRPQPQAAPRAGSPPRRPLHGLSPAPRGAAAGSSLAAPGNSSRPRPQPQAQQRRAAPQAQAQAASRSGQPYIRRRLLQTRSRTMGEQEQQLGRPNGFDMAKGARNPRHSSFYRHEAVESGSPTG